MDFLLRIFAVFLLYRQEDGIKGVCGIGEKPFYEHAV